MHHQYPPTFYGLCTTCIQNVSSMSSQKCPFILGFLDSPLIEVSPRRRLNLSSCFAAAMCRKWLQCCIDIRCAPAALLILSNEGVLISQVWGIIISLGVDGDERFKFNM